MKTQKLLTSATIAALITSAYGSVTIDWVTVGNPGNAADPLTGYGAVAYEYKIGKYEVTNAQYVEFLNAKGKTNNSLGGYTLFDGSNTNIIRSGISGSYTYSVTAALANRPVVSVSWYEAAQFANWMMNGQGNADMETGAYDLNAYPNYWLMPFTDAKFRLPTEDEWYKAAYYNGANSTYSLHANGQNSITTADANYASSGSTDVGAFSGDASSYGTFDQGGNVWEWNDAKILWVNSNNRGLRGGSWYESEVFLESSFRSSGASGNQRNDLVGFRLVAVVPEPSAMLLSMLASGLMLIRRKR
jgi:sulfatase modifying factor 1